MTPPAQPFSPEEIAQLSEQFEHKTPQEILAWAVAEFATDCALSSSFQTHSLPLVHMSIQHMPDIRIFFLDTGYHFWDTLIFRERMQVMWGLNMIDLYRDSKWDTFSQRFGRKLYRVDADLCCFIHKVQPMQKALEGVRAWITGIRREQTKERAHAHILELQEDGLLRVNPLLNWTQAEVEAYRTAHSLPEHPLLAKGYRSIGCAPCTRPVRPNESERAGRWDGLGKTECGLHTELFRQKDLDISIAKLIQDLP